MRRGGEWGEREVEKYIYIARVRWWLISDCIGLWWKWEGEEVDTSQLHDSFSIYTLIDLGSLSVICIYWCFFFF